MVCPTPQFQKKSEKEVRFLVNPFGLFPPFVGALLGCNSVINSQFTVDLSTCQASPTSYNGVPILVMKCAVEFPFRFGH